MVDKKVLEIIKGYFLSSKSVAAVYLFGSTVKGRQRPSSDIDLAVLFCRQLDKTQRFSGKLEIANDLGEIAGEHGQKIKFDVVDLKSADPFFIHQVMKNKCLIVDKESRYRVEFEVAYRKKFYDMQRFYEIYHEQVLRRLKERQ